MIEKIVVTVNLSGQIIGGKDFPVFGAYDYGGDIKSIQVIDSLRENFFYLTKFPVFLTGNRILSAGIQKRTNLAVGKDLSGHFGIFFQICIQQGASGFQ